MARGKRGRRGREEEEIPVAEPVDSGEAGGRTGRGAVARVPTGPSFALPTAIASGVVAGILAFVGALAVSKATAVDPADALDLAGIQAARMLAVSDVDRWDPGFGTTVGVRNRVNAEVKKRKDAVAKSNDERDAEILDMSVQEWMEGDPSEGAKWKPGFNQFFPIERDQVDDEIELARKSGLKYAIEGNRGVFVAAMIANSTGTPLLAQGDEKGQQYAVPKQATKKVGDTEVFVMRGPPHIRMYKHPMRNRQGNREGYALVQLRAGGLPPPAVLEGAAAAGGGAFIGAFLISLLMGMGTVKSIRKLAADTEALARGEFTHRVAVRGPDVVQAAARNVQRLGQLASEGGGGGPPQIVTQEVHVLPTEEIHKGLAPTSTFQRPAEFEIEATSKPCDMGGTDYYDVVNIDDEHVGFFVADATIEGVAGAMYMAQIRALFRSEAPRSTSPAEVLKAINRAFAADLPREVYVSAIYAVINRTTGRCCVANAQHLPIVFWKLSKKASAKVQGQGIALGLDKGPVFDKTIEEKAFDLDRGDRVVLFSDGPIRAKNKGGAQYGEERFYYVLNRESPKNSAAFVNLVANDVDLFHEGAPQNDDVTILTARRVK